MEPARSVIEKCGGLDAVAFVTGRSVSSVRKWTVSRDKRGTGGLIPSDCQVLLLRAEADNRWGLTPADFFPASVVGVS